MGPAAVGPVAFPSVTTIVGDVAAILASLVPLDHVEPLPAYRPKDNPWVQPTFLDQA